MINIKENPLEWSGLLDELDDAKDHLEKLVKELEKNGEIDVVDYRIQLGHVFAHLNRSWNMRNFIGEETEEQRQLFSAFPVDLEPVG